MIPQWRKGRGRGERRKDARGRDEGREGEQSRAEEAQGEKKKQGGQSKGKVQSEPESYQDESAARSTRLMTARAV